MFDEWTIDPISIALRTEGVIMVKSGGWGHDVGIFHG